MASPELQEIIRQLRSRRLLDLPLGELREAFDGMAFPVDDDVTCEPVDADGVRCEWIVAPGAARDRTILYLHGGGYVIGSIASHRALVANLSRAARARALAVDYRLAPEFPFPAAVEDAIASYRWLLSGGADAKRIVVAGDSAGGGLAVATLVNVREQGLPRPAVAVCLSPWVDLEGIGESMKLRADRDPLVQLQGLKRMATVYLGGVDGRTPLAAPLHADLSGLPPLLIQVGGAETLYDDATRLAARAREAGVEVTLDCWDEMIHVWQLFSPVLPEGRDAMDRIGEFVRGHVSEGRDRMAAGNA